MAIKRFFAPYTLIALLTGCAENYYQMQPQYPAPVYGRYPDSNTLPAPQTPRPVAPEPNAVVTKPLKDFTPDAVPIEITPPTPRVVEKVREPEIIPDEKVDQLPPLPQEAPAAEIQPKPEPEIPATFTPLESNARLSAPVNALVLAAKQDSASGNPEAAGVAIERAIRIEPRNATLYYKLAVIRLDQSQPRLAEDLAKKAALLASDNAELKKHSWLLIAKARELLSNPDGAKAAFKKAQSFR